MNPKYFLAVAASAHKKDSPFTVHLSRCFEIYYTQSNEKKNENVNVKLLTKKVINWDQQFT